LPNKDRREPRASGERRLAPRVLRRASRSARARAISWRWCCSASWSTTYGCGYMVWSSTRAVGVASGGI